MPGTLEQVEELRVAAREANNRGRPARGAVIVRRALRLLEDAVRAGSVPAPVSAHARARLLITLAFSEFGVHGLDRGQRALTDALVAAAQCDGLDVVALVHDLRGLMLLGSGDLEGSLPQFDAAIDLAAHLDPVDQAPLYLNRGSVQLFRRDISAARSDLQRCVALASALGLTRVESKARHNLGYAEFLRGNLPLALDILARAHALDADVSRAGLLDRARVLMEAGLFTEAEESLAEASRLHTLGRANQDRAEVQLAWAECALLQGNREVAQVHANRARRIFRRRQSAGWQARADLTRWQVYLDSAGGPARVLREIRSVVPSNGAPPAGDPEVLLIAAEAYLAQGEVSRAVELLEILGPSSHTDALSARLHHHLVRAGAARAARDLAGARRELRTGLTILASEQARHPSLELRTAMAVHGGRLAELDLRIAVESRSPREVFDSLERWRAMSHRRTAVTPPGDPELAELLSQLRMVSEDVRNAAPGFPVERIRRRQQSLERAVREREWRLQGEGRSERSARLSDLRAVLRDQATDVLSYFVLDEQLAAVTVRGGRCVVRSLGPWSAVSGLLTRVRADLDALAGRLLPAPLRDTVTRSLAHDLERLDRALLPTDLAGSPSLLVVPTRTLATTPWGMLPRRRGRPTTVSVSATAWLRGLAGPVARPSVVAVAGPGLALASREVLDVAVGWPAGRQVQPSEGSAGFLAKAVARHDLVHIAAHGTHNHDNPLFSSIRMGDGPLFAYDIPHDTPAAGHIVLSACDLGLATPRPGGEVLGLTAAFLGLGARCVVSSVARVDDTTAYETMVRYHRELASGADAPTALARADKGDLSRPAPFVCFGSPWAAEPAPPGASATAR